MKKLRYFILFTILQFLNFQVYSQNVIVDASPSGRQQIIDGFGTCTYFSTPVTQTWYKDMYFNDAECSIVRMDMTPNFIAPYSNNGYNSNGQARPYANAESYVQPFNGNTAQIAVMTPNINTNVNFFDFTQSWSYVGGIMAQTGLARKAALGDFKLIGSVWSPAPWLKITSGSFHDPNGDSNYWVDPPTGTADDIPRPVINGGNFSGGRIDTSSNPRAIFFDGVQNTSAITQYARCIAAYIRGFQNYYGVKFYAFSIQNELNFETFYHSSYIPKASEYIKCAVAVRRELDKYPDLIDIKIMGPEDLINNADGLYFYGGPDLDKNLKYMEAIEADTAAKRAVNFYNVHGYDTDGVGSAGANPTIWNAWANGWTTPLVNYHPSNIKGFRGFNKKSWMTETSGEDPAWLNSGSGTFPGLGAFGVGLNIFQALTTGYQSGYVYWQMSDGGSSMSSFGLTSTANRTNAPKYVAFKHFSKFIRPNSIRLNSTFTGSAANISSAAFVHDANKTLTYILINSDNATRNVTVNVPTNLGFSLTTFAGYRSSNGSYFVNTNYTIASNSITVSMPAYSIITLFGKGNTALSINPLSGFNFTSAAQSANLSVTGLGLWTINKTASTWLTLSTASGSGSQIVSFSVTNNTGVARSAVVTFAGAIDKYIFNVNQDAGDVQLTNYIITSTSNIINSQNGTLQLTSVPTPSNANPISYLWSVDLPSVATINASGQVLAYSNGVVVVSSTATGAGGFKIVSTKLITVTGQNAQVLNFKDKITGTFDGTRFPASSTLSTFYTSQGPLTINPASTNVLSVSGTGGWSNAVFVNLNGNISNTPAGINIINRPYATMTIRNPNAFPMYVVVTPQIQLLPAWLTAPNGEDKSFEILPGQTLTKTLNLNTSLGVGLLSNINALRFQFFDNTGGTWYLGNFSGSATIDNISVGFLPTTSLLLSSSLQTVSGSNVSQITATSMPIGSDNDVTWTLLQSPANIATLVQNSFGIATLSATGVANGNVTITAVSMGETPITSNSIVIAVRIGVPSLVANPTILNYTSGGSSQNISITSNISWTSASSQPWLTLTGGSGTNNGTISAIASANTMTGIRIAQVTISGGALTQIVNITQTGAAASLVATPTTLNYPSAGSSQNIGITSNVSWTSTSSQPWLTLTGGSGTNNGTISATASANTATGIRTAQVTITGGSLTQIVNITQTGAAANLVVTPTTLNYPSAGSSQNIGITSNVSWTSTSSQPWLTLTGGSGTNNGTISATATVNTSTGIRIAQVTISGGALTQIVNVTQTGAAASLVVNPSTLNYGSASSSQNISVTSNVTWASTSSQPWLTLTGGSGTNNGTISATATANTATGIRIAQVTISGGSLTQIVNITQTGAAASLVATPTTLNYPSAGSSQNIGITSNVTWTSTSSQPWLTLTNGSGTNNGTISATANANTATGIRIAQVTITGGAISQIVNITQTGAAANLVANPTTLTYPSGGSAQNIGITSNVSWTSTSSQTWLTLTGGSGTNNGMISAIASANTMTGIRIAQVTISGGALTQIVNITQTGAAASLVATPTTLNYPSAGSSQNIGITSNVSWTSTSSQPWLTLTNGSGTNNGTISATASINTNTGIRIAQVTISGGAISQIVNITQTGAAASLVATPTTLNYSSASSSQNIGITSNVSWTSTSSQPWLTLTNGSGTNNGTISATASVNINTGIRIAQVTISGGAISQIVNITQTGANPTVSVGSSTASFTASGGTQTITVNSNSTWNVTGIPVWMTVSPTSGSGNGVITLTAPINGNVNANSGILTITSGLVTAIINANQNGSAANLVASPTTLNYPSAGSSQNIGITSNVSWSSTSSQPWLTLTNGSGTNNGTILATASINTATGIRIGQVTISGGSLTQIVNITQTGAAASLVATPTTLNYPSAGSSQNIGITSNVSWTSTSSQPWLTLTNGSGTNNGTISATASINTATGIRIAQVTISGGAISQIVNITQTGAAASLVANPLILNYSSAGSAQNIGITSNVTWTSTSSQPWLTLTGGSGTNNGTISATAAANTATGIRIAQVTISGSGLTQIVNITQTGAAANLVATPTTLNYPSAGSSQNIGITSNVTWTSTSSQPWLTLTGGSGTNNGTISATATANTATGIRIAQVTISGSGLTQIVNITQTGAAANLVATPTTLNYLSAGSSQNIGITSNVPWTSTSSQPWLTLTGGSGTNNGTISATAAVNTATGIRIAQVTITGGALTQIVNITQTGAAASLVANPTSLNYGSASSSQNIGMTSNVTWTSTSSQPWLTLTGGSGSNNGSISATASINTATGIRIAQVTITGGALTQIVNITQTGANPTVSVGSSTASFTSAGGTQIITINSNSTWNVTGIPAWMTVSPTSGSGNGVITLTAPINGNVNANTGILTITSGLVTALINANQSGSATNLVANPLTLTYASGGSAQNIGITSNVTWTSTSSQSWLTLTNGSGTNNGTISATASTNTATGIRTAQVTITGGALTQIVNITQTGANPTVSVGSSTASFNASGGTQTITVNSNSTWNVTGIPAWMTVSPTSGSGNGVITLTAPINGNVNANTGILTITSGLVTALINANQSGSATNLVANPLTLTYASGGSAQNIGITSNVSWSSTSSQPWLTLTGGSGSNNGTISATASTNTATGIRTAQVTITGGSISQIVNITQTGANPTVSLGSSTASFTASGGTQTITVNSNSTWNLTGIPAWMTVSPTSGSGNGVITLTAPINGNVNANTGILTITSGLVTAIINVNQNGSAANLVASPLILTYSSAGSAQNIAITSNVTWTSTSSQSWLTLTNGSGTNNGTISATASTNTATGIRTAQVTITGGSISQIVNITQTGANPTVSLGSSTASFTASGGTQTITVNSNSTWNLTGIPAWMTVSPTSGSGNGVITLTAPINGNVNANTGILTITSGLVTAIINVNQNGSAANLVASPLILTYSSAGSAQNIAITSNVTWTSTSSQSWLTLTNGSGTNNGTISATATANTATGIRTAQVTITGGALTQIVNITQTGANPTVSVGSSTASFTSAGGIQIITINSNSTWNVTGIPAWMTVSPASGSGNGVITLTAAANMSINQQNATLNVSSGSSSSTVNINQTGVAEYLNTDVASLSFGATGGSNLFSILSNVQWIVVEVPTWITISTTNGFGNANITLSLSENFLNINRTYQLTVSGINTNRVVTINQDAAPVVGSLSESIVSFVAMGGLKSIDVLAGSGWTVTSNNTAVSVFPTTGNGNGTFSITGLPNRQNIPILATVSVNFGTSVSYIYITIGATTAVYNKNQSDKIDLILSPNPAKSNSFIKFNKQISFRMFDILGNLHGKATNVSEFQIINLPSGVYFIQTNENEVRKLVVE